MIDEIVKKAIVVTGQVFETMFFMPVSVQQEWDEGFHGATRSFPSFFRGEIGFEGRYSGTLILSIPVELAKIMATNFMGLDGEFASDSQTVDTVNELCNIICGNIFSQLDKTTVWNLTIPQSRKISGPAEDTGGEDQRGTVRFDAEGYPVQLEIRLAPAS